MADSKDKIYRSSGALTFRDGEFYLHGKPFRIFSGTMHYFRVHPDYWMDRFQKMKACGLNCVETYVCWNLHEEYPGKFNFDGLLDVRKFVQQAQEAGLYVIFRPGPYICAEWDLGGLPSWLLQDPNMKVRSNYKPYQDAVERFFAELLPKITDLQALQGGPIIAVQVENEFGSYSDEIEHLVFLKELLVTHGIKELLLTSDNIFGIQRAPFYEHALPTANFPNMEDGRKIFDIIRKWSKDFPLMVMEFWPGWFDHWGQGHKGLTIPLFEECLTGILEAGSSFNMYMFHGGTNFGFMAGANYFERSHYKPDVTSYDYDAPLSEAGDVTEKFRRARAIISKFSGGTKLTDIPPDLPKAQYGEVTMTSFLPLREILHCVDGKLKSDSTQPVPMELLNIFDGYGQNFGYTLYTSTIGQGKILEFSNLPKDRAQIFLNGEELRVLDWLSEDLKIPLKCTKEVNTLDILVENHGRVNYVEFGSNLFNEERKDKPSALYDQAHPDWAPSVKMGHVVTLKTPTRDMDRYARALGRSKKKLAPEPESILPEEYDLGNDTSRDDTVSVCSFMIHGKLEPTYVTTTSRSEGQRKDPEHILPKMRGELQRLTSENIELKLTMANQTLSQESLEGDDEKVRYLTGLSGYVSLLAVFQLIESFIDHNARSVLSKFQKLILTVMKLRLNLPTQDLAYRFNVSKSTVSRIFSNVINVMFCRLQPLVHWPGRDELRMTMPMEFRKHFGLRVAVIIDCFEIFIERPSNLLARSQTWSNYKHHNTIKYLIGIAPQGVVSFISKGYGGRASDKMITENCGILDKLLPGDIVLADRGFDIAESVGLKCAEVKIPSFTKGKQQLSPLEVESTRKIANVRIHVERVIGLVRNKYTILQNTLPIDYLQNDESEIPLCDKIVSVCCALSNLCESVVPFD